MMLQRLFSHQFGLPLLAIALMLGMVGCDSGVPPGTEGDDATTVQFASSGAAVTIADETASIDVSISNPDGQPVSVEVLFAQASSTADATDLGLPESDENAIVVETVSFPAGAEDGDTQSVTFDIGGDEPIEDRLTARLALQNLETDGSAAIGNPREFELSIGFPTIREVRTSNDLGDDVTVQGTVTRIDDGTAFMQDDSGGIAVFDDTFSGGVSLGDLVIVSGELDVFAGLLEIVNVGSEGFTVVSSDNEVSATTATLAELEENGEEFEATLVRVEGMSFEDSGTFQSETNYTVSDGSGGAVPLRVPAGSFYVGEPIPSGEVTFEGVLSQFNGNFESIEPNTGYQMLALDEGDITGGDNGGGGPQVMSINQARQSLGQEVQFEGTVTRAFGDYARVQDSSGPTGASALVIRQVDGPNANAFSSDIEGGTIQPGTQIQITGVTSEFNGLVQVNGGDLTDYQVMSQGDAPNPQGVTLADLQNSGEDYESELVEITDLTFPDASGTFENGTNYNVSDGSTTLTLRVQNDNESNLGGESIPDEPFTYTGVTGEFNENYQLIPIRPSDLEASNNGGGEPEVVTIAEARDQSLGSQVTIEGTVTRADDSGLYVQDDTAALYLFHDGEGAIANVSVGTRLRATGETDEFGGLFELTNVADDGFTVLEENATLPSPQSVTLSDIADSGEQYESELVEVTDLTITGGNGSSFEANTGYTADDGSGSTLDMFVPDESEVAGTSIPDPAVYTGVIDVFSDTFQLYPLLSGDVEAQ